MLAVAGGKGGVGKTTTALGVAAAFGRRGADPIVVDADRAMPNVHVAADTPAAPGVEAVAAGQSLERASHRSPVLPSVRVVPTAPGTDERTLRRGLQRLIAQAPDGRPLVLDCPAGAGTDAALPFRMADRTLVVSTATRESLVDAGKTATMARSLAAPPVGCVLTHTTISMPGVRRALGCPVLACVPTASNPLASPDVREAYHVATAGLGAQNV